MIELENPQYSWLLVLLPVLAGIFFGYRLWYQRNLRKLGTPLLVAKLLPVTLPRHGWQLGILGLAVVSMVLALLNPRFPKTIAASVVPTTDVVFLVDVSQSMLATDLVPDRLSKVRQLLTQVLATLDKSRVGVVLYAARAYPLVPLTDDILVAASFVPAIQPSAIAQQGTKVGEALEMASLYFDDTVRQNRLVFLLSDGENHDESFIQAAQKATQKGILIHTLGVGTPEGSLIPVGSSKGSIGFKTDAAGQPVRSRLQADNLRRIAETGQGRYHYLTSTAEAVQFVQQRIDEARLVVGLPPRTMGYHSLFQWFVGIALVWLCLEMILSAQKPVFKRE